MTEELKAKIAELLRAEDRNLVRLGRTLFWENEESFEDFKDINVMNGFEGGTFEFYLDIKQRYKEKDPRVI